MFIKRGEIRRTQTTLLLLILFLVVLIIFLTVSVTELANTLPTYADSANQIKASIQSFLADLGLSTSSVESAVSVFDPSKLLGFFTALLGDVGKALGNAVFMLLILAFMLFDAGGFPAKLMGGGLNLSPLVITISLFFWAWVLGPLGALIAVPLTLAVKEIVLDSSDDTRWLSTVMGSGEKEQTPTEVSAADEENETE